MNELAMRSAQAYGRTLMQAVTGVDCSSSAQLEDWAPWTGLLFAREQPSDYLLANAWSLVRMRGLAPSLTFVRPQPVTLAATDGAWRLFPTSEEGEFAPAAQELGRQFVAAGGGQEGGGFDVFYSLMQKYGSNLPCTYGEEGVSLFRQWALVAAVMALPVDGTPESLPADLALIGLDLPGIQDTVYTIASRGAGKNVRGRSAFLQLLVNAVVDRILHDLGLCRGNVIVNAGGNALILCGDSEHLDTYLRQLDTEMSRLVFSGSEFFGGFQGDLAVALAYTRLPWSALRYPVVTFLDGEDVVSEWQTHERRLKQDLQAAKQRPFSALLHADKGIETFFLPDPIESSRFCAVCRRPENAASGKFHSMLDDEATELSGAQAIICPVCAGMIDLAQRLGRDARYLTRRRLATLPTAAESWQAALFAASGGYLYDIRPELDTRAVNLAFSPDDFPGQHVHGCWPLARTTPREGDSIRDNASLAEESPGTFKRIGVLKADVDWLGEILVSGLGARRSAALTSTLSEALMLFFGGWLDEICRSPLFKNRIYILYAGGDDLLILGTWHVIPELAAHIAQDFSAYTGHNAGVHLSAGISVVGGKEPLYAAIEAADDALDEAKHHPDPADPTKNAISFMDVVLDWPHFNSVREWERRLREMLDEGAPTALLTTLLEIYQQYSDDRKTLEESNSGYSVRAAFGRYADTGTNLYLGPWLWQMVYRLRRLTQNDEIRKKIGDVQKQLLTPQGVTQVALSARWAQLVSRKDG